MPNAKLLEAVCYFQIEAQELLASGQTTQHLHTSRLRTITPDAWAPNPVIAFIDATIIAGGTFNIDLTALTGTQGAFSGLGMRVIAYHFRAPPQNLHKITLSAISPTISNAYTPFNGGGKVVLQPGGEYAHVAKNGAAIDTVTGTRKIIAGTGTEGDVLTGEIVLG